MQRRQKTFQQALVLYYGIDFILVITVMQVTAITQDEYSFFCYIQKPENVFLKVHIHITICILRYRSCSGALDHITWSLSTDRHF